MEDILQQLIDFVAKSAPIIWGVAIRQNYLYAWEDTIWGILILIFSLWTVSKCFIWFNKVDEYDMDKKMTSGLFMVIGFVGVLISLTILTYAFGRFYNPPYYAIQDLVNLAKSVK